MIVANIHYGKFRRTPHMTNNLNFINRQLQSPAERERSNSEAFRFIYYLVFYKRR